MGPVGKEPGNGARPHSRGTTAAALTPAAAAGGESARLQALFGYGALDTPPEEAFDRLTALAADLFDAPIALLSLVDAERLWFKSRFGTETAEAPRERTFCDHLIAAGPGAVMVVEDAADDQRFSQGGLAIGDAGVRFYAGAALTAPNGHNIGALCVMDHVARLTPSPRMLERLRTLAGIVIDELELRRSRLDQTRDRQLAEHASDITMRGRLDDPERRITYISPAVRSLGWDPEDVIGRARADFVHPLDRGRMGRTISAMMSGEPLPPMEDREFRVLRKSGDYVWMDASPSIVRDAAGLPVDVITVLRDIDERKTAEIALAESEARYRLVTEASRDLVLKYDLDATILYASSACRRFGYAPEDLIGTRGFELIHPDDHEYAGAVIAKQLRGEGDLRPEDVREFRVRKADGTWIWMEGNPSVIRDHEGRPVAIINSLRDVNARKAVEIALAASEARYRGLAEAAPDMISETGLDGTVHYISPACESVTGVKPQMVVGRNVFRLMHPDDAPRVRAACEAIVDSGGNVTPGPVQYRGRHADGREIWLESRPAAMKDHATGQVIGFIDVIRDITARKALEAELEQAREAAEVAAAVKGEFLANMSHELRTPLTSVLGFTQLALEQPDLSEATRGYISKAANAGATLLTTVNDILDFSKLEAGQVEIRPRASDPREVCAEMLELFSERAAEKGLTLRLEEASMLPASLDFDPDRLRQLLLNLVSNAVKFSDQGEVVVSLAWSEADETLSISVADNGPGIAPEQQARLFKRFSQVDGSSTRRHGGTGLGLAICMGLVDAMGGTIGVESQEGEGSRFFFTLPAPRSVDHRAADDEEIPLFPLGTRVLVADDHAVNRELVCTILTPLGAVVTEAANGAEAVEAAARAPFDIILMDLRMPGLDGMEAMRAIRRGGGLNAGTPILAFSAGANAGSADDRRSAGFDGDLSKPLLPVALITAVAIHTADWVQTEVGKHRRT